MSFADIFRAGKIRKENEELKEKLSALEASITPEMRDAAKLKETVEALKQQRETEQTAIGEVGEISNLKRKIRELSLDVADLESQIEKNQYTLQISKESVAKNRELAKESGEEFEKQKKKLQTAAKFITIAKAYFEKFSLETPSEHELREIESYIQDIDCEDMLSPTAELKLHNTDVKDLRKQFKDINKEIEKTLTDYEKRYTTKTNIAIYRLMVIALKAELQNVLFSLKFQKLDESIEQIHDIADKYLKIAADGNQSIAPTIAKFISSIELLFSDAVKVEYEYYVRKERAKEQQRALKEQMRQEAEERKLLEQQKKQVEKEESKYLAEIEKLKQQLADAETEKAEQIQTRIAEVENLLGEVESKKEDIAKLQNGKAGSVYIISNLGSFGDNVFKIGMTRRLEPQDRIDELGSASVPFKFDVHSFIFSEDASALETKLHQILNDKRTNKINLRKEFFTVTLDELENIVNDIEPTAEFNRTMLAEEYRQSMSFSGVLDDCIDEDDDNDE